MESTSWSSKVSGPKTGMAPGPIRMASATWRAVARLRGGA